MQKTVDTYIDNTAFLKEIDEYYLAQKNKCYQSIQANIECLNERYKEDDLPAITGLQLDHLDTQDHANNLKIPSPISIGSLSSHDQEINAYYDFIAGNGLCIEVNGKNDVEAHQFLQNIGLKILSGLPPSVANLVLIDPEGSGSNFKLLLGYEKARPNSILNRSGISSCLQEILNAFSKLQTEQLTFKYDSLEELNLNQPKLARPYTFIFISNYPAGFRKEDCENLKSIISKGSKYGTFVFISFNPAIKAEGLKTDEKTNLEGIGTMRYEDGSYKIYDSLESEVYNAGFRIVPETQKPSNAAEIIAALNDALRKSKSTSVSQDEFFAAVLSGNKPLWDHAASENDHTTGIKAPIGLKSATEELEFVIDCGSDNYHAIIGGKTGSGKTVLLDNIILNASIKYPPHELQFVLMDFKGGSFQKYRELPHVKILFGGHDRNYGLNVLRFLNDENKRRQAITSNINKLTKSDSIKHNFPRLIVILDEFQVLLKETDELTREAKMHIDTIAQQGRSAGIHLILSSQDLTGITISQSTQINANVRIALQMDPVACRQIFSMDNTEASVLEQKGEAIYNEKPGRPQYGNQRFRVYYIEDSIAEKLVRHLKARSETLQHRQHNKFFLPNEDAANATNNADLIKQLSENAKGILYPKVFLGEPAFIRINPRTYAKEDSYYQFKRAENSNLLIAGNDLNAASTILGLSIMQLAASDPKARIFILNNFGGDKIEWRERLKLLQTSFSGNIEYYQKSQAADLISNIESEIEKRKTDEELCASNLYIFFAGLDPSYQKQEFTVAGQTKKLTSILKSGPDLGIHTIIYSYSAKSFINTGIDPGLFESKILLRGDSKDIITKFTEQKELSKERTAYLFAPAPVASINPDLFNVYSKYDEPALNTLRPEAGPLIKTFLKDLTSDDQEP